MALDRLRHCYRTRMRLRVEPEVVATVRWYFCAPGAQEATFPHAFGSSVWETDDREYPQPGLGEIDARFRPVKSVRPPGDLGISTVTPLAWFSTGVPAGVVGPYPNGPCLPLFVDGSGGTVSGGRCTLELAPRALAGDGGAVGGGRCTLELAPRALAGDGGAVAGGVCTMDSWHACGGGPPLPRKRLTFTLAGLVSAGCAGCEDLNKVWVLEWESECSWTSVAMSELVCGFPCWWTFGIRSLGGVPFYSLASGPGSTGVAEYLRLVSTWGGTFPLTVSLGSPTFVCSGHPATVDIYEG